MDWLKLFKYTVLLTVSQIVAGSIVSFTLFSYTEFGAESIELFAFNYMISFIVSTAVLALLALNQNSYRFIHVSIVAFSSLALGNLFSYFLVNDLMPFILYIMDIAFTSLVILSGIMFGKYLAAKSSKQCT
jgi:hypothetical protein